MKFFVAVTVMCYLTVVGCDMSGGMAHNYEKMRRYGLGNRIIPNYRRLLFGPVDAYPEPLPTVKALVAHEPYAKIKQGKRRYNDQRVYRKSFSYPANTEGHRIICDNMLDCKITYMSVDTDKGIPIILRGGAGYRHFTIVVRAAAGDPLTGTITAYCIKQEESTLPPRANTRSWAFPEKMFNLTRRKHTYDSDDDR